MSWLRSRWVIVPGLLVLSVLGWNAYVWTHAGGVVSGRVVDASGRGVAGAEVVLYARSFLTNDEQARTRTDRDGRFRFTGNANHALQLQAQALGLGASGRVTVRLLFRGEDVDVATPLVLGGLMTIGAGTRLIFLAGDPVGHTKGYPEYAAALAAEGIDAAYLPAHVPAGRLGAFLDGLRWAGNVAGVVATVPHKLDALAAGVPDQAARRAGSANLLRPAADGGWECSQVDGAGFLAAADQAGIRLENRRVQLIGAGGAGRAVAMALAERGPAKIAVHDLDAGRAELLVADLNRWFPGVPAEAGLDGSEVLVNCSPAGMGRDDRLAAPEALIPRGGAVYDVVNRADTPLLLAARRLGCRADHGRSMMLAEIPLILRYFFTR